MKLINYYFDEYDNCHVVVVEATKKFIQEDLQDEIKKFNLNNILIDRLYLCVKWKTNWIDNGKQKNKNKLDP